MRVGGQLHAPAVLPQETRYPFYRRLGRPQGRSGRLWKISPTPGFDPRTVQPVASHCTVWAIPAHSHRCSGIKIQGEQQGPVRLSQVGYSASDSVGSSCVTTWQKSRVPPEVLYVRYFPLQHSASSFLHRCTGTFLSSCIIVSSCYCSPRACDRSHICHLKCFNFPTSNTVQHHSCPGAKELRPAVTTSFRRVTPNAVQSTINMLNIDLESIVDNCSMV
jgi:hypothetical protein